MGFSHGLSSVMFVLRSDWLRLFNWLAALHCVAFLLHLPFSREPDSKHFWKGDGKGRETEVWGWGLGLDVQNRLRSIYVLHTRHLLPLHSQVRLCGVALTGTRGQVHKVLSTGCCLEGGCGRRCRLGLQRPLPFYFGETSHLFHQQYLSIVGKHPNCFFSSSSPLL